MWWYISTGTRICRIFCFVGVASAGARVRVGDGVGVKVDVGVGVFVAGRVGVAISVNVGVGGMGAATVGERNNASTFTTMGKPTPEPTIRLVTTAKKMARKASLVIRTSTPSCRGYVNDQFTC